MDKNIPSVMSNFETVDDPRVVERSTHLLIDIISIVICAVIGNAEGWRDIEAYGREKESLVRLATIAPPGVIAIIASISSG